MKASLKKFQGRGLISLDSSNEIKFDSALVIKMKDVLTGQGGRKWEKQMRQSDSNLEMVKKNSVNYQEKKNDLPKRLS